VLLKSDLDVQQTLHSDVQQKPLLNCNLSVVKFIATNCYELGHTIVLLKPDLFNKPYSGYVEQKPLLDCNLSVAKFIATDC
jgi:hypothetical protein